MKAGAIDVLEKPVDEAVLISAIRHGLSQVLRGQAESSWREDLEKKYRSLPTRQRQVLALVSAGLLNKQIGAELGISERTVKIHRERLRRNLNVDSTAGLSRLAEVLRIVPDAAKSGRLIR
jgi:FixJ family two-component response regulator